MNTTSVRLEEAEVDAFEAGLRGNLLHPRDDGYNEARTVWNAMIDERPALIARCAGAADVVSAVNFARDNDLLLSVRGGGHSVAGLAVRDGGLMIDLSPMKAYESRPFGQDYPELLIGDPDTVSRRIEAASRAVPINECFLLLPQGILDRDRILRSLELFATRVMPRFA